MDPISLWLTNCGHHFCYLQRRSGSPNPLEKAEASESNSSEEMPLNYWHLVPLYYWHIVLVQ